MIPPVKAKLLEGKRGLVVGIANENSIAWGCAKAFRAFGAELAITYLNEKAKKYVEPLARELEAPILMPLDTNVPNQMEAVFDEIAKKWGTLDFVVHSIAFAPKETLQGRVVDVAREGFLTTMDVSCWTFLRMAHLAEPLMREGGSLFTMTYYGSQMVVENYNITAPRDYEYFTVHLEADREHAAAEREMLSQHVNDDNASTASTAVFLAPVSFDDGAYRHSRRSAGTANRSRTARPRPTAATPAGCFTIAATAPSRT